MNDGRDSEPLDLDVDGATDVADGFSRDAREFDEAVAPLRTGLTSQRDGRTAWASASLIGAADFLDHHFDVKQSADSLLGIVAQDIDGMGQGARDAVLGLHEQDGHNSRRVDPGDHSQEA